VLPFGFMLLLIARLLPTIVQIGKGRKRKECMARDSVSSTLLHLPLSQLGRSASNSPFFFKPLLLSFCHFFFILFYLFLVLETEPKLLLIFEDAYIWYMLLHLLAVLGRI
jgi:hypothetical protein